MGLILTIDEVKKALYLDFDYDTTELDRLSKTASSFILRKTGYDFGSDAEIEPLAKEAAIMAIERLREDDIISVVTYAHHAEVLLHQNKPTL